MKKVSVFLTAFCLFSGIAIAADSPIDKGSVLFQGGFEFSNTSGDIVGNESLTQITIQPAVGVFVSPGFILGGELLFQNISWGGDSQTSIGIGPFAGYYFDANPDRENIKGKAYPYILGQFVYTNQSFDGRGDVSITAFGGKFGIAFMMSEAVSLDSGIGVMSQNYSSDGRSASGIVLSVTAGVTAFIW